MKRWMETRKNDSDAMVLKREAPMINKTTDLAAVFSAVVLDIYYCSIRSRRQEREDVFTVSYQSF